MLYQCPTNSATEKGKGASEWRAGQTSRRADCVRAREMKEVSGEDSGFRPWIIQYFRSGNALQIRERAADQGTRCISTACVFVVQLCKHVCSRECLVMRAKHKRQPEHNTGKPVGTSYSGCSHGLLNEVHITYWLESRNITFEEVFDMIYSCFLLTLLKDPSVHQNIRQTYLCTFLCNTLWSSCIYMWIILVIFIYYYIYSYTVYVTLSVKSRLKSKNLIIKHQNVISTIHFTIISIFNMTLLSQYYRYKGYIFTECSLPYEGWFFCRKQQMRK